MITLLIGDDAFLMQTEIDAIKKKYIDPATSDFNFQRFSAKNDSAETILDACASLPMMAEFRLVLVFEAESIKKEELEKWTRYFEKPSPSTHLVLSASKIDRRLKIWQTAAKSSVLMVELKAPYPNQLPPWIIKQAASRGLDLDARGASLLAEAIGANLMTQIQTLEMLATYVYPKKRIGLSDIERLVGNSWSQTIFDFTEKVGERNLKEAEFLLEKMLVAGEPPVRLLFMLARHFRLILLAHEGISSRWSENEMAGKMGVNPYFVGDYLKQARKLSPAAAKIIYKNLLNADREAKSSPLSPRFVLDRFLLQACSFSSSL